MTQDTSAALGFADLRQALSAVYDHASVRIDAFHDFPVIQSRLNQLKSAFANAPKANKALEFGVFNGVSLCALAHGNTTQAFVGFDSFEGLPEAWHRSEDSTYEKGHFALDALPPVPGNVSLVKGFIEDTLGPWLAENPGPVGFVHIDVDLYSASRHVLDALTDRLLDGAVIVFDELADWRDSGVYSYWEDGEWKALKEWLQATGFSFRILSRDERFAAAIQVFRGTPPKQVSADYLKYVTSIWQNGDRKVAITLLTALAAEKPDWITAHHRLAHWQVQSKDFDAASRTLAGIWDKAVAAPDNPLAIDLHRLRADCLYETGDHPAALEHIEAFRAKRPDHVSGITRHARVLEKLSRHEESADLWRRAYSLAGVESHMKQARVQDMMSSIRPAFRNMYRSGLMIQHLVDDRSFKTVLDIGSGTGEQAATLRAHGKTVTELDYGVSDYFTVRDNVDGVIIGDFMKIDIEHQFDCAIASHVLEHQLNVNAFLTKLHGVVREGGLVAISVPPHKPNIVGGHMTMWNAGLVLYNLILAGFDCSDPWIRTYGYNVSVVIEKKSITPPQLAYDTGDVDKLKAYFPPGMSEGFNGDIASYG